MPETSSKPQTDKPNAEEGSIKETVEAILIAFILAFIFRGFVVEAFVIPTGSMAPTLLGAHMRFICDDCGYQFDVNFNPPGARDDDLKIPDEAGPRADRLIVCPNCGYTLPASEPRTPAYNPLVRYGDRILVLKYLYLFQDPKRWDVVVFKSPDNPERYDYSQNYIKRLIGKPNEAVMILDGDIYVGDTKAPREQLTIQTKPRDVQDALWRLIHDVDYQPRGLSRGSYPAFLEPWKRRSGQIGWDLGDASSSSENPLAAQARRRVFNFNNLTGGAEIFFDEQANIRSRVLRNSAFNDWLAYDIEAGMPPGGWSLVGDLKVEFFYERRAGDGPLQVMLAKRGRNFIAEITPTAARLLVDDGNNNSAPRELIPPTPLASRAGSRHIEFSNVDYRVALRVDDVEIFATTPEQYHPDVDRLLTSRGDANLPRPEVRIAASKQNAEFKHLSVWRDIYYLNVGERPIRRNGRMVPEPFSASPENVMRLGADEFFVMGDNSQISGDGRYWSEPTILPYEGLEVEPGKVPGRFMLGKAFFVYWPAGYRPFESRTVPALVPNFGDMRRIH